MCGIAPFTWNDDATHKMAKNDASRHVYDTWKVRVEARRIDVQATEEQKVGYASQNSAFSVRTNWNEQLRPRGRLQATCNLHGKGQYQ